jgi:hypothetical protein
MMYRKRHVDPTTWLTTLEHILAGRRGCLLSGRRQAFEAGATR